MIKLFFAFALISVAVVGFYAPGWIVEKEFEDTLTAANGGNVKAQVRLAQFYQRGSFSAAQSDNTAIYWFKIAAENGSKTAKNMLLNDYKIRQWRY